MSARQLDRQRRLAELLQNLACAGYWYGVDTGDYSMDFVDREEFFRDTLNAINVLMRWET
jgi:hypothetical protein